MISWYIYIHISNWCKREVQLSTFLWLHLQKHLFVQTLKKKKMNKECWMWITGALFLVLICNTVVTIKKKKTFITSDTERQRKIIALFFLTVVKALHVWAFWNFTSEKQQQKTDTWLNPNAFSLFWFSYIRVLLPFSFKWLIKKQRKENRITWNMNMKWNETTCQRISHTELHAIHQQASWLQCTVSDLRFIKKFHWLNRSFESHLPRW